VISFLAGFRLKRREEKGKKREKRKEGVKQESSLPRGGCEYQRPRPNNFRATTPSAHQQRLQPKNLRLGRAKKKIAKKPHEPTLGAEFKVNHSRNIP